MWNSRGKSDPSAPKPTQKHSFLKRVAQLVKRSEYACHVMSVQNVWNMPLPMMNDSEFGAVYLNANAVVLSAALRNFRSGFSDG
jgi:hypothetical protein